MSPGFGMMVVQATKSAIPRLPDTGQTRVMVQVMKARR